MRQLLLIATKKLANIVLTVVAFLMYVADCYFRGDFEATAEERTQVWKSGLETAWAEIYIVGTPFLLSLMLILHSWWIPGRFYGVPEKGALDETGRVRPLMCMIVGVPLQIYTLGLGLNNGVNSLNAYIWLPAMAIVWVLIGVLKWAISPDHQTWVNYALFVVLAMPVGYFAKNLMNGGDFDFLLHGPGDTK